MARRATSGALTRITLDPNANRSIVQQIFDAVRDAILTGRLERGQQVPPTRQLASKLRVARSTVVLAYEQLIAEGYLGAAAGSGSFVLGFKGPGSLNAMDEPGPLKSRKVARRVSAYCRAMVGRRETRGAVPFRLGEPALDAFPTRTWQRLHRERWAAGEGGFLAYGDPAGYTPLREALVRHLAEARGLKADAAQVLLVRGVRQGLDLVARVLLDPGDAAWVEDPGEIMARAALAGAGARIVPVPVDDDGLDVSAGLEAAPNARLACVAPAHQFPLGVAMSLARRAELLEWASAAGAWIVENDAGGELRSDQRPAMALQGLDADDRVIYAGSFSKTLFPALRLGYLIVPKDLVASFARVRAATDHLSPTIEQAVIADFLTGGHFARHVRRMRALYRERRDALVVAVRHEMGDLASVTSAPTGMHLIAWLHPEADDRRVSRLAGEVGIDAPPLSLYGIETPRPPGLVLGYASLDERAIQESVRTLRDVLERASA